MSAAPVLLIVSIQGFISPVFHLRRRRVLSAEAATRGKARPFGHQWLLSRIRSICAAASGVIFTEPSASSSSVSTLTERAIRRVAGGFKFFQEAGEIFGLCPLPVDPFIAVVGKSVAVMFQHAYFTQTG